MIAEEEMINVEQREKIRRAYFVEEKSIRQIARELKCSRPTVRKAIASATPASYTLTVSRPAPVLGSYKERIRELLAENERLPRKQRYTGHKIYQIIQKEGYTGSESTVRGYIAQQRREKKRPKVYIPLEFDPGTDAQVDWGEGIAIIAGQRVTVQLFYMRLCYSRKLFMMAFPSQRQEAFFEGHVRAFHHFQGIPRRISYDNLKTAVKRILEGRNRQEQEAASEVHWRRLSQPPAVREPLLHAGPGQRERRCGARSGLWPSQLHGAVPERSLLRGVERAPAGPVPGRRPAASGSSEGDHR